eukprot:754243-Hanusia_phi.AAC.1
MNDADSAVRPGSDATATTGVSRRAARPGAGRRGPSRGGKKTMTDDINVPEIGSENRSKIMLTSCSSGWERRAWPALSLLALVALTFESFLHLHGSSPSELEAQMLARKQALKQTLLCQHRSLTMRINARTDARSLGALLGEMSSDVDQDKQEAIHSSEIASNPGMVQKLIEAEIQVIKGEQKEIMDVKHNLLTRFDDPSCYDPYQASDAEFLSKPSNNYLIHMLRSEIHNSIRSYMKHIIFRDRAESPDLEGNSETEHERVNAALSRMLQQAHAGNATTGDPILTHLPNSAAGLKRSHLGHFDRRQGLNNLLLLNLFGSKTGADHTFRAKNP